MSSYTYDKHSDNVLPLITTTPEKKKLFTKKVFKLLEYARLYSIQQ